MWRATLPVNASRGDLENVKGLSVSVLIIAIIMSAACARTPPPIRAVANTPAATPTPTPAPAPTTASHRLVEPVPNTWPKLYEVSNHSIRKRLADEHGYELSADYPQLSTSKPEVRRFNRWIKRKILGYAAEFRRLADAEQRRKKKHPPVLWGLELSYSVYYSNERLVSLRLAHVVMQAGQMHPIAYYETINYDLSKGRQLRAKDVFKRGYLKALSDYSRKELTWRYEADDWIKSGTKPYADNFANWNIVPEGILISFEDYQVGPHSFGQPEFVVPFSDLKSTVRREGLRRLLPANKAL
jgi:uncharacterized protein DUF3298